MKEMSHRFFMILQQVRDLAPQIFTEPGHDRQIHPGHFVLAVVVELRPLQFAGRTDLIFADTAFLQTRLQLYLHISHAALPSFLLDYMGRHIRK